MLLEKQVHLQKEVGAAPASLAGDVFLGGWKEEKTEHKGGRRRNTMKA